MKKIKLFCFPYAGGSSLIFKDWKHYISPEIELIAFELAGRGRRTGEQCYESLEEAVDDIFIKIEPSIVRSEFAFFGHSLGGLIAFELAKKTELMGLTPARHLFVSGRNAPGVAPKFSFKFHALDDEAFTREIVKLGGTPRELFDHPELLHYFLPILKSDFKLSEANSTLDKNFVTNSSLTVMLGDSDSLVTEGDLGWDRYTSKSCSVYHFKGDHFFINDRTQEVVTLINTTLVKTV